ncbi:MAG: hypothetical protein SH808_03865 [Saprospiraceae bacterium]|nr:hypothetical protein [Saprospiraceae bacterium]
MKQSPFKFQGNNSKQVKGAKTNPAAEHEEGKGKLAPLPKDLKKVQPKAKLNTTIRTGRPVNAQRPQGK